jgi:quercetin dioxygenase-like cupin family protein
MKIALLALLMTGAMAPAPNGNPVLTKPSEIQWGEHPFIKGAKLAVQSGDPGKGASVLLMKFPKGMTIPAHTHTSDETVTLISGSGIFGGGETVDAKQGTLLAQGAFITIPGKAPHWAIVKEELVFTVTLDKAADFHLCGAK